MMCSMGFEEYCRSQEWCVKLEEIVRSRLGPDPVHGYPHTVRVARLCMELAGGVGKVDLRVLIAAALLHDLGRVEENAAGRHHALLSTSMAKPILDQLGFSGEEADRILRAIAAHSFSLGRRAESVEANILSDADKLDAMGAVGIARAFIEGDRRGRGFEGTIAHFKEKLLKLRDMMYTELGRRLAEERHRFMEEFLEKFLEETGIKHDHSR